jgi:hypothetical protein
MSETPANAPLDDFLRDQIPRLAILYDRFAYALNPFDQGRDLAEQMFNSELANWFPAASSSVGFPDRPPCSDPGFILDFQKNLYFVEVTLVKNGNYGPADDRRAAGRADDMSMRR